MKRFAVASLALIALLGFTGCELLGGPGDKDVKEDPKVTLSDWKIKGSFDGWQLHQFTQNAADANQLTFLIEDLNAIDYEFVLVDPAGTEIKYSTDDNVTPGTAFTLGGESGTKNVSFTATQLAYKLEVNVANPAAPVANLIGNTTPAKAVTNAILLEKLKIKGNQFSQVDGVAVAAWSEAAGTISGNSKTFDILVDNKNGEFGFTVLEGFVAHVDIDASGLTATTSTATTPVELLTTGGNGNTHLTGTTKSGSVYTITVTVDASKTIGTGRYMISAALKTLSTTDWAFEAWSMVYMTGAGDDFGNWGWTLAAITPTAGVAEYTFKATATAQQFKINKAAAWDGGQVGINGIDSTGSGVTLSGSDNIEFTAVVGNSYKVKVDFTSTNYVTTGKPTVTVTDLGAI